MPQSNRWPASAVLNWWCLIANLHPVTNPVWNLSHWAERSTCCWLFKSGATIPTVIRISPNLAFPRDNLSLKGILYQFPTELRSPPVVGCLFKSGATMHHCCHPYRRMHHHSLIIIIIIIMFLVVFLNRERWCSSIVNCGMTCDDVYPALMFIKLNTSSSSSSMFLVV